MSVGFSITNHCFQVFLDLLIWRVTQYIQIYLKIFKYILSNGSSCNLYCTRNTPLCPLINDGRRKVRFPITLISRFDGRCIRTLSACRLLRQLSHVSAAGPRIRKGQKFSHQQHLLIFFCSQNEARWYWRAAISFEFLVSFCLIVTHWSHSSFQAATGCIHQMCKIRLCAACLHL
jgi:hypothetical protein